MSTPARRSLLLFSLLLLVDCANAATVRGRLQRLQNGQSVPVGGVAVTLKNSSGSSLAVTSDASGMYYLPNVQAGSYTLQVWARPGTPPYSVPVQVNEPRLDVTPLNLP